MSRGHTCVSQSSIVVIEIKYLKNITCRRSQRQYLKASGRAKMPAPLFCGRKVPSQLEGSTSALATNTVCRFHRTAAADVIAARASSDAS